MLRRGEASRGKGFHDPEFILMPLAVAHAKEIRKLKSIGSSLRAVRSVDSAPHVAHLIHRHVRPLDDLRPREFRNCKYFHGAVTSSFQHRGIVQPNQRTAVLRTVNVTQVVNGEDERGRTE